LIFGKGGYSSAGTEKNSPSYSINYLRRRIRRLARPRSYSASRLTKRQQQTAQQMGRDQRSVILRDDFPTESYMSELSFLSITQIALNDAQTLQLGSSTTGSASADSKRRPAWTRPLENVKHRGRFIERTGPRQWALTTAGENVALEILESSKENGDK
jgi:hypothetical protein